MKTLDLSIAPSRITFLVEQKGIIPTIASIDLEMVKFKLNDPFEGEAWTAQQGDDAEIEYKRYLHLCLKYGRGIVPNRLMDTLWHYHILDTIAYVRDCERVFGGYLHHFPYFGMRGADDAKNLKVAFNLTQTRYLETFGEPMVREEQSALWTDCENQCWHACTSQESEN